MNEHLITLKDWSHEDIADVLALAARLKQAPEEFAHVLEHKTLMMFFEKPSLRTRVSFETGMTQMGGHAIFYDTSTSPLGAGKETVHDTVKTVSRYVDLIMARLFEHSMVEEMARYSSVPVINALTNYTHPCQILADLMTIQEHKGGLEGLTLAYMGDSNNNVTHSLLLGAAKMGLNMRVGCPAGPDYSPVPDILEYASETAARKGHFVEVTHDALEAARGADVVYTDSWMSYHIPPHQLEARVEIFGPYQVNAKLMAEADDEAIFMNCLPAIRGYEQTAEVIDGPRSVVFDEAENRLHAQKAVMLTLLGLC